MSTMTLERKIWLECQQVIRNPEMREKDLLEWSIGSLKPREGEVEIWLPDMQRNALVPAALDRREIPGQIGFDGAVVGQ